jgi:WD40 repeat protein
LIVSNRGINYSEDNYSIPGPEWGTIQFFNLDNGQLMHVLIAGNQATALDISRDKKKLAFSNFLDHNVYICDLPSFETLKNKGEIINYKEKIIK